MSLKRMQGSLGAVFLLAAAGLFTPDAWHPLVFAALVLVAVIGLYDAEPLADSLRRQRAERVWGDDPSHWPAWECACGQRNVGWALECGRCERPRDVVMSDTRDT